VQFLSSGQQKSHTVLRAPGVAARYQSHESQQDPHEW